MPPRYVKARAKGNSVTRCDMKGVFYQSLKLTLKICRCLGFLPISGLATGEFSSLKWRSPYMLIYVPSMILQAVLVAMYTYDYIVTDDKVKKLVGFLFFITSFMGSMCLYNISRHWHTFLRDIETIEKLLPPFLNSKKIISLGNWIMASILVFGLLEYILYLTFAIVLIRDCNVQIPDEPGSIIQTYFTILYNWVYNHIAFSFTSGFIILLSELQSSFVWNVVDALIVVICIYLANVFRTYNQLIMQKQLNLFSKNSTPSWSELQMHYTRISRLVTIVDDEINPMIFISFSSNLISICQQLFFILNKLTRNYVMEFDDCLNASRSSDWLSALCIIYTFLFIITRTMLVSFFAAEVNSLSREPLNAFNIVPSSGYNDNMKRLMTQVYHSRVHLSGLNLFHITRGNILTMVGALMTYELVLLQI